MASEKLNEEMVQEAKSIVAEMEAKTFQSCCATVEPADIINTLQELGKTKLDVKEKFHKTLTLNYFMQNLAAPKEEWDSLTAKTEEELQTAKATLREAKHRMKEQKKELMQLNTFAEQGLTLFHEQLQTLKDRCNNLEDEIQAFHQCQEEPSDQETDRALKEEIQRIETQLAELTAEAQCCHKELLRMEHTNAETQMRISQIEDDLQQLNLILDEDQENMDTQCLSMLEKTIVDMESLSGVTCQTKNPNTIVVKFPPRLTQTQHAADGDVPKDDLVLEVTLTFQKNNLGYPRLSEVKTNVDSFDVNDLMDSNCVEMVNLRQLVSDIKMQWLSHVPLLSEINHLRSRFAVDWIQQENILRVIAGKGGGIVCSLEIPPGYPHQGQVTLTNVMGTADDIAVADLKPSTGNRLEDWVQFLENLFGKP